MFIYNIYEGEKNNHKHLMEVHNIIVRHTEKRKHVSDRERDRQRKRQIKRFHKTKQNI